MYSIHVGLSKGADIAVFSFCIRDMHITKQVPPHTAVVHSEANHYLL